MSANLIANFKKTTGFIIQDIEKLSECYTFRNYDANAQYLKNNPHLIYFLIKSRNKFEEYFPEADFILEVLYDPNEDFEDFILWIRTSISPEEAFKRLKAIDSDWWLKQPHTINNYLTLNLDLI